MEARAALTLVKLKAEHREKTIAFLSRGVCVLCPRVDAGRLRSRWEVHCKLLDRKEKKKMGGFRSRDNL